MVSPAHTFHLALHFYLIPQFHERPMCGCNKEDFMVPRDLLQQDCLADAV